VSDAALFVERVSKRFRLYRERPTTIKQRLLASRSKGEDFWALRDVSFEVAHGRSLGLVGHNGSGKTTLLKCVAGILRPTDGLIRYRGRVVALLELGAGFHPELTGKENVYLNASFLGLGRRATDLVYDDIVGFAELGGFMGTQVKFYSSGMLVRLGFAVAVHVDPDVLLIDEVLAVGDESFQRRCLDRIAGFQREGRTIVLVTHALDTVRDICDQAVMLHHGRVHTAGDPDHVVRELRNTLLASDPNFVAEEGDRRLEIADVRIEPADGGSAAIESGRDLVIQVDVRTNEPVPSLDASFAILSGVTNHPVTVVRTKELGVPIGPVEGPKRIRFVLPRPRWEPGRYFVTVGLESPEGHRYHVQTQRYSFRVEEARGRTESIDVRPEVEVLDL
jgi:ABC-2 type transport system ATP-binding protein